MCKLPAPPIPTQMIDVSCIPQVRPGHRIAEESTDARDRISESSRRTYATEIRYDPEWRGKPLKTFQYGATH